MNSSNFSNLQTVARAHRIWQQAGQVEGHSVDHWLQAEREIQMEWKAERVREMEPPRIYQYLEELNDHPAAE